jgi:hypothetical protein
MSEETHLARSMPQRTRLLTCKTRLASRTFFRENAHVLWLALLALGLSVGWYFFDADLGVNLSDEGYLWYGTEAVRHGLVPMRDFQAYDPGRYAWTAGWSLILGGGLMPLRLSCTLFGCLGVFAGLMAARRLSRHWAFLVPVGLLLCAWMHPRYKCFEQSIALMFVYAAVLLLEKPTLRRQFCVGIFGGLMAFMGRNHGAYFILAFGILTLWVAWGQPWSTFLRRVGCWVAGMLLGYLPQWLMFLFVPGYFRQFVAGLSEIANKGTNLTMPVRWPWLIPVNAPSLARLFATMEGCFYVLLPVFLFVAAVRIWQLGRARLHGQSLLLAAACVTLPYTHYVFSRPDVVHLAHAGPSLSLGVLALAFTLPGKWVRAAWVTLPVLLAASLCANFPQYGITIELFAQPRSLFAVNVAGRRMVTGAFQTSVLLNARELVHRFVKPTEPILFLPNLPALYPFTGRLSPTKQIYFIFPATPEEDRALLDEIRKAGVQWVMIHDYPLDGRDDLRFRNIHPLVYQYFQQHFKPLPTETLPEGVVLLQRLPPATE